MINWFYQTLNPEKERALAEVKKTNVAKLPIRTIEFANPTDVSKHDRLVAFVDRMLDLNKRQSTAQIEQEQTVLKRQIEVADRQIDVLVYELYGLTEEEIALVEQAK